METELDYTLLVPVSVGDITFTTLRLTEPTHKQLTQASKAGADFDVLGALIRLNAAIPQAAVDQLRQRDLDAIADFFAHFGSAAPPRTAQT